MHILPSDLSNVMLFRNDFVLIIAGKRSPLEDNKCFFFFQIMMKLKLKFELSLRVKTHYKTIYQNIKFVSNCINII